MKILFNKKNSGKIIIPILIITFFVLIGTLIIRKTQQIEKESIFSKELIIDNVSDLRTLGYSGQRKIVQDDAGNIFVTYRKDYQKNAEIFVSKISQDINGFHISDTEKPIAVVGKNNDQRVPSLAIDSKNTLHTVWYGSDTENAKNNRQIKYSRKHLGAKNWESWRNISYVSGYDDDDFWQEHPTLLIGKDNELYVAWEGKDEENKKQQIKFSKSNNGGTIWSKWKNIAPSKNNTQSRPTLVEDRNGKLFIFAYSSQGNENDLQQVQFTSSSDKGESWTNWQSISNPTFDARHISVAVDKLGKIHVVWRAQTIADGPTQIIYRSFYNNNWSSNKVVFTSRNYQFFPNIGTDKSGLIYISWMENTEPSEFPRENPLNGFGLVSFLENGNFKKPMAISNQKNILYPNTSEKINADKFIPILYTEEKNEKEYQIKLKFLNSTANQSFLEYISIPFLNLKL